VRKRTWEVKIGEVRIGGKNRISIQSMTNTRTSDIDLTLKQIDELYKAGANIVRLGIPDMECARAISQIKKEVHFHLWQIYILIIDWLWNV